MKKYIYLLLVLCCSLSHLSQAQSRLLGDWEGVLRVQGIELPLVIHLSSSKNGFQGSFDSPKQKAFGIALSTVEIKGDSLVFTHAPGRIRFAGMLRENDSIVGTFTQGPQQFDLSFGRVLDPNMAGQQAQKTVRSQQPQPPFPYAVKEVKVKNKKGGHQLAGTLTMPHGKGPFPAVVLVSGSGPQNRNSEVFDHEPFWVLADYLSRAGIAVLRYDDRGVAQSTGDFNGATSEDFAEDALAVWEFLRKQKGVDKKRVGMIGHSEGGMIVPIAYAKRPELNFAVLMAGVGIPVKDLLLEQLQAVGKAEGLEQAVLDSQMQENARIFGWLNTLSKEAARDSIQQMLAHARMALPVGDVAARQAAEAQHEAVLNMFMDPWFLFFIKYDPAPYLQKLQCPVLAINGDQDVQVVSKSNLTGIQNGLTAGGNKNYKICELEGLNHLFQPTQTGAVSEYAEIDITFDEKAMATIAELIKLR